MCSARLFPSRPWKIFVSWSDDICGTPGKEHTCGQVNIDVVRNVRCEPVRAGLFDGQARRTVWWEAPRRPMPLVWVTAHRRRTSPCRRLTNQTTSSSAFASSMTARFGSEGRDGPIPSIPSYSKTSEAGVANTRRFLIWRAQFGDGPSFLPILRQSDRSEQRQTDQMIAHGTGRFVWQAVPRRGEAASAENAPICLLLPAVVPGSTAHNPIVLGQAAGPVSIPPDGVRSGPGTIPRQSLLLQQARQPPVGCSRAIPPATPSATASHRSRHASRNSSRNSRAAERRVVWASAPPPICSASHRAMATARLSPLRASGPST